MTQNICSSRKHKNMVGKIFNLLTVVDLAVERKRSKITWECKCICGNTIDVIGTELRSGNVKSCGCARKGNPAYNRVRIVIGKKYNSLTLVKELPVHVGTGGRKRRYVECICDCGNIKSVRLDNLTKGEVKSCGCIHKKPIGRSKIDYTGLIVKHWKVLTKSRRDAWLCRCILCGEEKLVRHTYLNTTTCHKCKSIKSRELKEKKFATFISSVLGSVYGNLTAVSYLSKEGKTYKFKCKCVCGKFVTKTYVQLKGGKRLDCGCVKRKELHDRMVGRRIGRLTVIKLARRKHKNKDYMYICQCDCGNIVWVIKGNLKENGTRSCGCLQFEVAYQSKTNMYKSKKSEPDRIRSPTKYKKWKEEIIERDLKCRICSSEKELVVHHLLSFNSNKELRFDINNGTTLCRHCHDDFHTKYTSTNFSVDDYLVYSTKRLIYYYGGCI